MSLQSDLAAVVAGDARYDILAYAFVLDALEHTRQRRIRSSPAPRGRASRRGNTNAAAEIDQHVSGQELCVGVRELALSQFGRLAITVLAEWGIRSTSDVGNIVYNMIAAGDLEKTDADSRSDFDNVFDFETALVAEFGIDLDETS